NYLLVFIVFFLRFDAMAAMYARMSSNIIRTTINIPAVAVVTGLFPESYRALIRPFLRGTVVRIGLFIGSGLILVSDALLFHPRNLSLVAMPFVLAWVIAPFVLKRRYAGILLDLIADDSIDFRSLDANELSQVFRDPQVQESLIRRFQNAAGEDRLWHARLLQSVGVPDLDELLLMALAKEPHTPTRIALVELLSDEAAKAAAKAFPKMMATAPPELIESMIEAGRRMSPAVFAPFNRQVYESSLPLAVRARAVGALYAAQRQRYAQVIDDWMEAEAPDRLRAGIIAAGSSRDARFGDRLKALLSRADDDSTRMLLLRSLKRIAVEGLNPLITHRLGDADPSMRRAVLELYRIEDEASLKNVIPLLGDEIASIAELAREKIRTADFQHSLRLIKSLSLPQKKIREALFDLLADMAIKDRDVFRFVRNQARTCYELMIQAQGVRQLPDGELQRLLAVHLDERVWFTQQTTLLALAAHDRSGRIKRIARGIFSGDKRQRANSLEAMDDILDHHLVRLLTPLFDDMDTAERIAAGRRLFPDELPGLTTTTLMDNLLFSRNWVTLVLTLSVIGQTRVEPRDPDRVRILTQ
ncbi:MAG: hypothetical protein ACK2TX_09070, partial [Anaerolineales bacterium]